MRIAILVTVVALIASLALFWVFADGSAQAPRSDQDQGPGGASSATASIELAQDRRELEPIGQAGEVAAHQETPLADASLEVTVLDDRSGNPLPDVKLTALEFEAITDAQGQAQLRLPSGYYRLRAEPPDETLQPLDGRITLETGEHRKFEIRLRPRAELPFCGRLVASGKPVAGAELQLRNRSQLLDTLHSASDGSFAVSGNRSEGYVQVAMPGYAAALVTLVPGHETPEQALVIELQPGANLEAEINFADGSLAERAELTLEVNSYRLIVPKGYYRGPFVQSYRGEVDRFGRLRLENLPASIPLELRIEIDGNEFLHQRESLFLEAGDNRKNYRLEVANHVLGTVIDQDERPVEGVKVAAVPATGPVAPELMPFWKVRRGRETLQTGADGRFEFSDLPSGNWLVGVFREPTDQNPICTASCSLVELVPGRGPTKVEVRVWRDLYISGRALSPEGELVAGMNVIAKRIGGDFSAFMWTKDDGTFRLGPLHPGDYEISSNVFGNLYGLPATLRYPAGSEDLELRLVAVAGSVRGTVREASSGAPQHAWLLFRARNLDDAVGFRTDVDGRFRCLGLAAGIWDLVARDDEGNAALISGIEILPGRDITDMAVDLGPAAQIVIHHPPAKKPVSFEILQNSVIFFEDFLSPPGIADETRITIPPGRWLVRILVGSEESFRQEIVVRAGTELRVGPG